MARHITHGLRMAKLRPQRFSLRLHWQRNQESLPFQFIQDVSTRSCGDHYFTSCLLYQPIVVPGTALTANNGVDQQLFIEGFQLATERNGGTSVTYSLVESYH